MGVDLVVLQSVSPSVLVCLRLSQGSRLSCSPVCVTICVGVSRDVAWE